jgi:ornithine cyclodeaminase/alanine dehydrogenase
MTAMELLYLSAADVQRCGVTMREVIELVELALAEHGNGRTEMPPKLGVHPQPGALLHAMPAFVPAANAAGMKWVAAFPQNARRNLPAVSGTIVLNDPETGLPLAVMDATWITAMRTAASAGVAARYLAPSNAETLAIVGPGVIGRASIAAMREVLPQLRHLRAFAPRQQTMEKFAREMQEQYALAIELADSAEHAARGAEVVITAAPWPRTAGVAPLGCNAMRDILFCCALDLDATLTSEAVQSADRFFADDVATFESHRQHGYFQHWRGPSELSRIVTGELPSRKSAEERIICANLGLGIYDVVVARKVWERAKAQGVGVKLAC